MTQTNEQILEHWKFFLNSSEGSNVVSDVHNGDVFSEYLRENHQDVSYATLCRAIKDPSVLNRLHLKSGRWTAEQIAAKAAEERAANEAARIEKIAADWVKNECPLGLLQGNDPYPENSSRIVAWVQKNGGTVSADAFNRAVKALSESHSLVWLSEDRELRNQPAAPPRKLSRQAQIDAGMIPDDSVSKLRSHTNDSEMVDPNVKMREVIKKIVGSGDPWMQRADALVITNRRGQVDAVKTAEMRKIIVRKNGVVDGEATYKMRNAACDGADRLRNRD